MTTIPSIDFKTLVNSEAKGHQAALQQVRSAATDTGFMTIANTPISKQQVLDLLAMYKQFFSLPEAVKSSVDMSKTGSNRGWGDAGAEQVSEDANPDFKQVFDSGPELKADDPLAELTYYAPNRWPSEPAGFRDALVEYYGAACNVSLQLLSAIAVSIGEPADHFANAFAKPMALLRGNYYPVRPEDATAKDFGIAEHTDYGCLTLLATDGSPGLEVKLRDGSWQSICVAPGEFVINFGEMLEYWTAGRVVATPHRVIGSNNERISVPLFFNPRHDVNVAPVGNVNEILAGDHLGKRYDETYLHRKAV